MTLIHTKTVGIDLYLTAVFCCNDGLKCHIFIYLWQQNPDNVWVKSFTFYYSFSHSMGFDWTCVRLFYLDIMQNNARFVSDLSERSQSTDIITFVYKQPFDCMTYVYKFK